MLGQKYSWSKSWINTWIIVAIVEVAVLIDLGVNATQNVIRKDGYCVMYGERDSMGGDHKINKVFNHPAPVMSEKGYKLLQQVCPYLAKDSANNTRTCCDYDQLVSLKTRIKPAIPMLARCPSCSKNFNVMWCEFTCSPNQSNFLSYTVSWLGATSDYYTTSQFSTGMFKSIENVAFPGSNNKVMDLMCGTTAKDCTEKKFFDFMGRPLSQGGHAPFKINFYVDKNVTDQNITNIDSQMLGCNESFFEEHTGRTRDACSCQDCTSSCAAPPSPPLPPRHVYIMGVPLYYFIVGLCLLLWIVLFLAFSAFQSLRLAKKAQVDFENQVKSLPKSPSSYATDDIMLCDVTTNMEGSYTQLSMKSEIFIQSAFRRWGTWSANHPYLVILCSLLAILVCSLGLLKFTVITNPVDLWTSPSSKARIQKEFFDEHFTPFYRTSQIIITSSVERPVDTYLVYPFNNPKNFSGIMYKDILDEVLSLQLNVMNLTAEHNGKQVKLQDICLQPLSPNNKECAVFSLLQYWQLDQTRLDKCKTMMDSKCGGDDGYQPAEDWHDQVLGCSSNPTSNSTGQFLKLPCMSTFGAPMPRELILGGYEEDDITNAKSLIITIPIINHKDEKQNNKAIAWERVYIDFLKKWEKEVGPGLNISIAYTAEYAMQDEISRAGESDYTTVLLSYSLMFLYIAISLGQYRSPSRIIVDAKVTVGIVGVLIVLMSVSAALGIGSYFGLQATLIIIEVIPFLVLAVGVDNIFILVQELQRTPRQEGETIPEQVGRVVGGVGPSMLLCSLSESVAFAFGALSQMPAVHTFAALAAIAVAVNFFLQITVLIAVLSLDAKRQSSNKFDLFCCFGIEKGESPHEERYPGGILYHLTKNVYAPFLMLNPVRVLVVISFSIYLCCSICMIPNVNIGISQTIALPADSFLHNYFGNMSAYLKTGAPVYFVIKDGIDYSTVTNQNLICNSAGCNSDSLIASVFSRSLISNYSKIALPASSWIDDYFTWIDPQTECCRILNYTTHKEIINGTSVEIKTFNNTPTFCPSTAPDTWHCYACLDKRYGGARPTSEKFREFLPWYLEDNPNDKCAKGGHAAYGNAVKLNELTRRDNDKFFVNASYFMAYHSVLTSAGDFTDALRYARELSANISQTIGHEVFPYSIFYVFYEQYLTIRDDTWKNLLICLSGIFVVTFLLLGLNIRSAACVTVTVSMIVVNLIGWMYLWDISLNAVSLVNLVMSVGISVEFCSHVVRAFSTSPLTTRVKRAEDALARVGSGVLSGITMTKCVGVFVLMFAESKLFEVYYFRMYSGIIVLGALHGLVFLPVLLSYIGPASWAIKEKDTKPQSSTVIENLGTVAVKISIEEGKSEIFFIDGGKNLTT